MKNVSGSIKHGISKRIIESGGVDLIDLKIMKGLLDGKNKVEVAPFAGLSSRSIDNRLSALKRKKIVLKERLPLVDIFRLFDHVLGVFIKINLASAVPAGTEASDNQIEPTPPGPAWEHVLEGFRKKNCKLYDKLVRLAIPTVGTEEDLFFIITTQSLEEYVTLIKGFQTTGTLVSVRSMELFPVGKYTYDPIAVPDPVEVDGGGLLERRKSLESRNTK